MKMAHCGAYFSCFDKASAISKRNYPWCRSNNIMGVALTLWKMYIIDKDTLREVMKECSSFTNSFPHLIMKLIDCLAELCVGYASAEIHYSLIVSWWCHDNVTTCNTRIHRCDNVGVMLGRDGATQEGISSVVRLYSKCSLLPQLILRLETTRNS